MIYKTELHIAFVEREFDDFLRCVALRCVVVA